MRVAPATADVARRPGGAGGRTVAPDDSAGGRTVSLAGRVDAGEVQVCVDGADDGTQSHQHEQYDDGRRQHLMTS